MKLIPRNRNEITSQNHIQQSVIKILITHDTVIVELTMINPHIRRFLNGNQITSFHRRIQLQVADDNIARCGDFECGFSEAGVGSYA